MKFTLAIAVTCWAMWAMSEAYAHSFYSKACCDKGDCAPAKWVRRTDEGGYVVKTEHGIMVFKPGVKILPAPDGKWHGCMFRRQVVSPGIFRGRCLYGGGFVHAIEDKKAS